MHIAANSPNHKVYCFMVVITLQELKIACDYCILDQEREKISVAFKRLYFASRYILFLRQWTQFKVAMASCPISSIFSDTSSTPGLVVKL